MRVYTDGHGPFPPVTDTKSRLPHNDEIPYAKHMETIGLPVDPAHFANNEAAAHLLAGPYIPLGRPISLWVFSATRKRICRWISVPADHGSASVKSTLNLRRQ
ncbi:hypothetical protein KM043_017700 [Ampulex compressa]|nr:hypothetical protein KM043_017700 [Ampulex compressa]